jgi:hypothetical protein
MKDPETLLPKPYQIDEFWDSTLELPSFAIIGPDEGYELICLEGNRLFPARGESFVERDVLLADYISIRDQNLLGQNLARQLAMIGLEEARARGFHKGRAQPLTPHGVSILSRLATEGAISRLTFVLGDHLRIQDELTTDEILLEYRGVSPALAKEWLSIERGQRQTRYAGAVIDAAFIF